MSIETEKTAVTAKITRLIKDIGFCMLTTQSEDGSLHSRPMHANANIGPDLELWFFTYGQSYKVFEAVAHPQCSVTFSDIKNNTYVSVSGLARLVRDQDKINMLWKPELKAWFPQGLETPDLALLKVTADRAEYWDGPAAVVTHTISFLGALTGVNVNLNEHAKTTI
jgi:general stress protein 26